MAKGGAVLGIIPPELSAELPPFPMSLKFMMRMVCDVRHLKRTDSLHPPRHSEAP